MWTEEQIRAGIEELTLDELVGQLLCYETGSFSVEQYDEIIKKTKAGSVYMHLTDRERAAGLLAAHKKYCKVPTMLVADVEEGAANICGGVEFPSMMGCSSTDDPELMKKAYHITAQAERKEGVSLALSPVVDINYNTKSSVLNVRAASDSPEQVIKMGKAMLEGLQQDGLMAACCKHFPGDGMDDRNQHFMTTINSLSREEWMNTYGRVYREMIKAGTMAIMVAHIALPAFDEKIDDIMGYPPATLSKNLMTGLLKGELGFDGCIVSDALSMVGACAMAPAERLAVEYLKAGGDMLLFPLPTDFDYIKAAVESGELPIERVKDAVTRIWRLKNAVRLLDENDAPTAEELVLDMPMEDVAQELADKSLKVIRDVDGLIAGKGLKAGAKVLHVLAKPENRHSQKTALPIVEEELKKRGIEVTTLVNPGHNEVKEAMEGCDYVLLSLSCDTHNNGGGTLRIGWEQAMIMWRAYILQHPRLIVASFGDPYKLYDYPYLKTYINCYSKAPVTQRALVKLITGEIEATGKNPVGLKGFFERETI